MTTQEEEIAEFFEDIKECPCCHGKRFAVDLIYPTSFYVKIDEKPIVTNATFGAHADCDVVGRCIACGKEVFHENWH